MRLEHTNAAQDCARTSKSVMSSRSTPLGLPSVRASPARVMMMGPKRPALACACWSTIERYRYAVELLLDSAEGPACVERRGARIRQGPGGAGGGLARHPQYWSCSAGHAVVCSAHEDGARKQLDAHAAHQEHQVRIHTSATRSALLLKLMQEAHTRI